MLLFLVAYVAGAGVAHLLARMPDTGISIWPPSGLFVATLILTRRSGWPWWIVAAFAAEMVANLLWFANPAAIAVPIFLGNAGEAVIGAALLRHFQHRHARHESVQSVLFAILVCGVVAPMVSASVGAATLALGQGQSFLAAWPLFWIGDSTGVLVITPLVLVLVEYRNRWVPPSAARLAELAGSFGVLGLALAFTMSGNLPFAYLAFLPLLWISVRFEFRGAVLAVLLLACLATGLTLAGYGQFAGQDASIATRDHVLMQLFLSVSAVTSLVVAALAREQRLAAAALRENNAALEREVADRTAAVLTSERQLKAVLEALPLGVALVDLQGRTVIGTEMYRHFVPAIIPSMDDRRIELWVGFDANGDRLPRTDFPVRRALRGERVWPGQMFLYRGEARRDAIWLSVAALPFRNALGEVVGAAVVISDIDREKRASDALVRNEERFRQAARATGAMIYDLDLAEPDRFYSHGHDYVIGTGSDTDSLSMQWWRTRIHPDDRARFIAAFDDAARNTLASNVRTAYRLLHEDGSWREVEDVAIVIRSPGGRARRIVGTVIDVTERREAERQVTMLAREAGHRAKNVLAVVRAMIRQSARHDEKGDFIAGLEERITGLGASYDLLVRGEWSAVDLAELIGSQLQPFTEPGDRRVRAEGPPVRLSAAAAQALGLAIHELATNAAKHGALSTAEGRVEIGWTIEKKTEDADFAIVWRELDGPPVHRPEGKGFGYTVTVRMVEMAVSGRVDLEFPPDGLVWSLRAPIGKVLAQNAQ